MHRAAQQQNQNEKRFSDNATGALRRHGQNTPWDRLEGSFQCLRLTYTILDASEWALILATAPPPLAFEDESMNMTVSTCASFSYLTACDERNGHWSELAVHPDGGPAVI